MKNEIGEKSYKKVLIYYNGCVTVKDLSYATINSINSLYLIIDKINRYIDESKGNKYLILILTDESKATLKMYEEI